MFNIFKKKPKSILGIDIGTSSVKVVQLKKEEEKFKLENYGQLSTFDYLEKSRDSFQTTSLKTLEITTREMLRVLLDKTEIDIKYAVMSVPVFSSFVSVMELPQMPEKELAKAVEFEARRYVPISLSEVVLDWKIIGTGPMKNGEEKTFQGQRILLIAVPKEVVNKYIKIVETLKLKLSALELESFSLARSLALNDPDAVCILDIGARATSFTIVDKNTIQLSHSLDVAGAEMTRTLAGSMGISPRRAEDFKLSHGTGQQEGERKEIEQLLNVSVDKIINEIERMIGSYRTKTQRDIKKLILNGGSAKLFGLKECLKRKMGIETTVANPWTKVTYPSKLEKKIQEIGPDFSVAVGAAMRQD